MSKKNIDHSVESRVCFEQLEEWVREQIQFYVQELLEDEVTSCWDEERMSVAEKWTHPVAIATVTARSGD